MIECYAYVHDGGEIDIDTLHNTTEGAKMKMLEQSMGWRFQYPDRYSPDEHWDMLLQHGEIKAVTVQLKEHGGSHA